MEEPKMGLEEYKGVYIYAQQVDNKLSDIAFELVGKAKELAADLNTEVTAVLLGSNVKALATELGEYGADKVIVVDDPPVKRIQDRAVHPCTCFRYREVQTGRFLNRRYGHRT